MRNLKSLKSRPTALAVGLRITPSQADTETVTTLVVPRESHGPQKQGSRRVGVRGRDA